MPPYFENLLLPRANHADVTAAISNWHSAASYTRETGRLLFDYRFQTEEQRVFVISNEKWCLLIYSNSSDEKEKYFNALATFPALVELWAKDKAWGFRLRQNGKLTAAWSSKRRGISPGEPRTPALEAVTRLTEACGILPALPQLQRAQKKRHFLLEKTCAGFAEVLGAPLAVYRSFYDLDHANAGVTELRQIAGYHCQLLVFSKNQPVPTASHLPVGTPLTAEDRAQVQRIQKRTRWLRLLLGPFLLVFWIVFIIPFMLLLGVFFLVAYLYRFAFVRTLSLGNATLVGEDFVAQLRNAEPKQIQFEGDTAINTRHGCSIIAPGPAIVHPNPPPYRKKCPPQEPPVFEIKLGENHLFCEAHPSASKYHRHSTQILETRILPNAAYPVSFRKERHQHSRTKTPSFYYYWDLGTPRARYTFSSGPSSSELTPADFETFEKIVLSFKV